MLAVSCEDRQWADGVAQVAVIGAGTMGEGIAQSFAEAGIMVRLIDVMEQATDRCVQQIAVNLRIAHEAGVRWDAGEDVCRRIVPIVAADPVRAVGASEMVIETVPEIAELKRSLFARLDALPDDVIVASNTSSMTMDAICEGLDTAHRAIGVHYFNPAHLIPAVELHRAAATADITVTRTRAMIERCGKVPFLVAKSIPGLVINRLTGALMREIGYLLDEGVISPEDLDAGVKASIGFRMGCVGPMEGSDFTGLDTGARVQSVLFPTLSNRTGPSHQLTEKVERGELGLKALKGWYSYQDGDRERLINERNAQLLQQLRMFNAAKGREPDLA